MRKMFSGGSKVFYLYRYISLGGTSLVYAIEDRGPPLSIKIGIILALFIFAKWITDMYSRSGQASRTIKITVGLEMTGMMILHLLSGGMDSPFLWCVFNPAWMAASYLSSVYCWFMMLIYFLFVTAFSYFFANDQSLTTILLEENRFYLMLLFMTLSIQLLAGVKSRLEIANARTTETMEHMKSLYQFVEAATHSESENLKIIFAEFALKLTKLKMSFFWDVNGNGGHDPLITQGITPAGVEASLIAAIDMHAAELRQLDSCMVMNLPEYGDFLVIPIKSSTRFWGVMGVKIERSTYEEGRHWFVKQLYFLSELCAVILERHQLERIENQLMIIEEQNRIADEMHDSVSQYIFGIVYAVHSLSRKWKDISTDQIKEQLQIIQESSVAASQELRSTIYSLSSRKNGGAFWITTVKSHLDSLSKLHAVKVTLNVTGDDHGLQVNYQKALFRIISEATGNAIRHGRSSHIKVDLSMKTEEVRLSVLDNGSGFSVTERLSDPKVSGLGVSNMELLVHSFGGTISIQSTKGKGTHIQVTLPTGNQDKKEQNEFQLMG
ncbi:ATP-binding protein [Paenibacillus alginolyticus]|uniref:Oxygen sensor histidine kinase NreB n=1 Tax=Paenibacillus alginolyticus TaxID=59839 RepID=A0ABT4GKP9_9BACL|nr:ATP-binding protein [Paenibacillus alginolyticus]MCY9670088.1 ATP-binding protein [Paenibacillus alginolyticus]MCY9696784.1 ATP-binding protein [Paenibacillus alginolyticus]MEC0147702.1 ATP-binding protein [Paenibacillus alginolyticus]